MGKPEWGRKPMEKSKAAPKKKGKKRGAPKKRNWKERVKTRPQMGSPGVMEGGDPINPKFEKKPPNDGEPKRIKWKKPWNWINSP